MLECTAWENTPFGSRKDTKSEVLKFKTTYRFDTNKRSGCKFEGNAHARARGPCTKPSRQQSRKDLGKKVNNLDTIMSANRKKVGFWMALTGHRIANVCCEKSLEPERRTAFAT